MRSFEQKLDRALDHLGTLNTACHRFFETDPCGVSLECDLGAREHVVRLRVWREPPTEIAGLASDCFHNLRQALDHIAYRLAIVISNTDPPPNEDSIYFPIASSPQEFEGKLGSSFGSPKQIPADIRALLESVQPYHGGNGQFLSVLQDLDNYDKHRYPPLMVVGGLMPSFNIGTLSVNSLTGPELGPVKAGADIMRFVPVPDTPVQMDFPSTMHIAFAEGAPGHGHAVISMLMAIRSLIRIEIAEPLEAHL